ncbi:hypothetical protein HUG10_08315 [Halorarum halophilum]|uniref:Uncharacterized protein n=1 Tax=Halorarum halophilum TaxID=2743090 RepID=A0A7D5K7P0_9EURY|nr:hypothetical protein [Halobaculum halophilum]QLG27554.1 hypothetical protein HUG10_08315 [Halobaculum halophilum]
MGFVWVSQFECASCGAREATTRLEYDDLGYAVCPGCGRNGKPAPKQVAGQ